MDEEIEKLAERIYEFESIHLKELNKEQIECIEEAVKKLYYILDIEEMKGE